MFAVYRFWQSVLSACGSTQGVLSCAYGLSLITRIELIVSLLCLVGACSALQFLLSTVACQLLLAVMTGLTGVV